MTLPLTNETALVTGGSRSIGAAIAKKLSADRAAVAFTYAGSVEKANELVRTIESTGGRALDIRADNADPAAVKNAVDVTLKPTSANVSNPVWMTCKNESMNCLKTPVKNSSNKF